MPHMARILDFSALTRRGSLGSTVPSGSSGSSACSAASSHAAPCELLPGRRLRQRRAADHGGDRQQHDHAAQHAEPGAEQAVEQAAAASPGSAAARAARQQAPDDQRGDERTARTPRRGSSAEPGAPTGSCGAAQGASQLRGEIGDDPAGERQQLEDEAAHRRRRAPRARPRRASRGRPSRAQAIPCRAHSVRTTAGRPAALSLGERRVGLGAGGERADAHADAAAGRRLRDLGVGLEAELLDLLARLARRVGVGEGADLDDEARALGRGGRAAGLRAAPGPGRRRRRRSARAWPASAASTRLRRRGAAPTPPACSPPPGRGRRCGACRRRGRGHARRRRCGRTRRGDLAPGLAARLGDHLGVGLGRGRRGRGRDAAAAPTAGVLAAAAAAARAAARHRRLRGISIGMSTGIGRGWVSNTQREADDADHQQHRGADQALPGAGARLLRPHRSAPAAAAMRCRSCA